MIATAAPGGRCSRTRSSTASNRKSKSPIRPLPPPRPPTSNRCALIKEAQAGLFPTVTVNYNHDGHFTTALRWPAARGVSTTRAISTLSANASWDLDLWGKIRRTVESDVAGAQVSAADLANAKLSTQALLATAYYNLRAADALQALLDQTVNALQADTGDYPKSI